MINHYDAFISYRHLPEDKTVAEKLQNYLEKLKIKDVNTGKKRHLRIFRDQSELFTSNDLGANIRAALDGSDFLIILYSHTTKESKWCMEELNYFRSLHENTNCKVLPLIIEGEPDEVFPEVLRWEERRITDENGESQVVQAAVEPLGADIRERNLFRKLHKLRKTEYMRIAAPIMGCRFDDIFRRNFRRRVRMGITISGFVLLACFLVFLLFYRQRNSELTEAATYSTMAGQQEEKEHWKEALMYYNEAVSRNPALSFEASSALLLLQEQQWPCITRIDEDRHISNGLIEPSLLETYENIVEPVGGMLWTMDSTVSYYLVGLLNDENQFGVYNLEGVQTSLLENVGTVMYDSYEQDYWAFYRQDGTVTLYNPAEDVRCAFTIENPAQYSGWVHVIPAGKDNCLILNEESDSLSLYQIDFGEETGNLLFEAPLSGIFKERYSEEEKKYGKTLAATYLFRINPEQDIALVGRTISSGSGAWSNTAVLRLSDLTLIKNISDDSYALNQISCCSGDNCFALAYGNDVTEMTTGGYAAVYDFAGTEMFCTDINSGQAYYGAAFRNDGSREMVLWSRNTLQFWNYETGIKYAADVESGDDAFISEVVCTEDVHCIAEMEGSLYYYNIFSFSAGNTEDALRRKYNSTEVLEAVENDHYSLKVDSQLILKIEEVREDEGEEDASLIRIMLTDLEGNLYEELKIEHEHPVHPILEGCPILYTYSAGSAILSVCIDYQYFYRIGIMTEKPGFTGCEILDDKFMSYICCPTESGILAVTDSGIYYCDNNSVSWTYIGSQRASGTLADCITNWNGMFLLCIENQSGGVMEFWDLNAKKCIADFKLNNKEVVKGIWFLTDDILEYDTENGKTQILVTADSPDAQAQKALSIICGMMLEDGEKQYIHEIFDGNLGSWSELKVSVR